MINRLLLSCCYLPKVGTGMCIHTYIHYIQTHHIRTLCTSRVGSSGRIRKFGSALRRPRRTGLSCPGIGWARMGSRCCHLEFGSGSSFTGVRVARET
ncbi:hypothetical protein F5X96DRAFT_661623 [Biscogniauxia mediterranea]|nr:hypothetical protein F5X96DRAFT_661623 [Biscogniauxia mediterranea]